MPRSSLRRPRTLDFYPSENGRDESPPRRRGAREVERRRQRIHERERGLAGTNGYEKDLRRNPVEWLVDRLQATRTVSWLDLCCGTGKALVEGAGLLRERGLGERATIVGVDLVPMFVEVPGDLGVRLVEGSIARWTPRRKFDLVTCVHGLHYVGDKLGALVRVASWLGSDGMFLANLDVASIQIEGGGKVTTALRQAGFQYAARQRLISRRGPGRVVFPFRYLGANDAAGPNYTGQPAVDSHYRRG